jgi:hypothetical protein
MLKQGKPQWVVKKYMCDDPYSWAVIDSRYLPKGHRGMVIESLPDCAIAYKGLGRKVAKCYCRIKKMTA